MAGDPKKNRRKVTFEWNGEDMAKIYASLFTADPSTPPYKFFDLPITNYGSSSFDTVKDKSGKMVGYSMFGGYSYNERRALTLGVVNPDVKDGEVLTLVWGEENGGTKKVTVERHRQLDVQVRVSPVPFSSVARETYAEGWRTKK